MTTGNKRVFTHEEAFPELGALALGALSTAEIDAIVEHVSHCSVCSAELAVMYDTAAALGSPSEGRYPLMTPARSAAIRAELMERARQDAAARTPESVESEQADVRPIRAVDATLPVVVTRRINFGPVLATAIAASIVLAIVAVNQGQKTNALRQTSAQLSARIDSLERELSAANRMLVSLAGKEVRVVDLVSTGTVAPSARMFWDVATDRWTMFGHDLPALAAGKTYVVWLINKAGQMINAGAFAPSVTGEALHQATYALAPDSLKTVAVTEESAPDVPQPTGPIVIAGNAR